MDPISNDLKGKPIIDISNNTSIFTPDTNLDMIQQGSPMIHRCEGFLHPNCQACGSSDHGLLKYESNIIEDDSRQYQCPCIKNDEWDENLQTMLKNKRSKLFLIFQIKLYFIIFNYPFSTLIFVLCSSFFSNQSV